jgi:hypothetical protein
LKKSNGGPLCGLDSKLSVRRATADELEVFYQSAEIATTPSDELLQAYLVELDDLGATYGDSAMMFVRLTDTPSRCFQQLCSSCQHLAGIAVEIAGRHTGYCCQRNRGLTHD